jgi:hypothetical protein
MPTSINRLMPQAIVLAVALFWCWPSLKQAFFPSAPPKSAKKEAAAPEGFSAAALSPKFPPIPKRNPFELLGATRIVKDSKSKGSNGTAMEAAEKAIADVKDSGLILNATLVMGQQRLAYINGRVYREKETISIEGRAPDAPTWVVTSILPHKVLLSYQGTPLQLNYTNGVAAAKAPRAKSRSPNKGAENTPK